MLFRSVALGVCLPVFAGIEVCEHKKEQHRKREAYQADRVVFKRRRKKDVAQQHGNADAYRAPVIETLAVKTSEEVHHYHHDTRDIEQVEHQFGPCLAEP